MKLSREFVRDGEAVSVQVERVEGDRFRVRVSERVYEYDARALPDGGVRCRAKRTARSSAGSRLDVPHACICAGVRPRISSEVISTSCSS